MRPLGLWLAIAFVLVAAGSAPATEQELGSAAKAEARYGKDIAWAARRQTWIPAIYNPSYRQIPYPDGDVPWYIGVCTDVIVRAYRRLGIDLQVEVQKWGAGSGDTNIDHRRVEVLRTFFARAGRSLPITKDPADYMPGDIVSYYVPTGHFSKTHIAIVSDRRATGGTPLVLHNRGLGCRRRTSYLPSRSPVTTATGRPLRAPPHRPPFPPPSERWLPQPRAIPLARLYNPGG